MSSRILIVDDDLEMCRYLEAGLRDQSFDVRWTTSSTDALGLVKAGGFDAVVTDLHMKSLDGIELCQQIREAAPEVPTIVVTAFGSLDKAISAIRAGAYDFITKPFEIEQLVLALQKACDHRHLREEVRRLRDIVDRKTDFAGLVGESSAMSNLYHLIGRVSDAEVSLLIQGETGTGKELVARAIHQGSRRRSSPFVAINCSALPENLLESELFGYARGAFTDARSPQRGLLLEADGGTLFLDEIGDLPLSLQPKLLRALQERKVRPLGAAAEISFDVRLIAATNLDLEKSVSSGRFREDLYFRLNVVRIPVPPLRERDDDVLVLAHHFLRAATCRTGRNVRGFTAGAARKLREYPWPGNVRELQNCVEHSVILTQHEHVLVEDLPERIRDYRLSGASEAAAASSTLLSLEEMERIHILRVLESTAGNKTLAAQILGLDRKTLYRKLERYQPAVPVPRSTDSGASIV